MSPGVAASEQGDEHPHTASRLDPSQSQLGQHANSAKIHLEQSVWNGAPDEDWTGQPGADTMRDKVDHKKMEGPGMSRIPAGLARTAQDDGLTGLALVRTQKQALARGRQHFAILLLIAYMTRRAYSLRATGVPGGHSLGSLNHDDDGLSRMGPSFFFFLYFLSPFA